MTSVNATTATTATTTTPATTTTTPASTTTKKSFDALFAEAKDDLKKGEKLSKVDGHQFGRIKGGDRDEMCVNLSGNARSGQAFDLVWRDGRQFHIYGSGKDRHVVEVGKKAASTTDTTSTSTDSTTSTDATKSTGTTTGATSGTSATTNTSAASTTGGTSTTA
ncbi:hypothetical protein [Baekduia sp. Peel2402]|uniref:hypothetical protein n=1 Tax=Baekduia sp. Peel2402 TaxID=3458296 RepID=UPI00403E3E82